MIKRELLTEEEAAKVLEAAKAKKSAQDVYDVAWSMLIRIMNEKLGNRGKKYQGL